LNILNIRAEDPIGKSRSIAGIFIGPFILYRDILSRLLLKRLQQEKELDEYRIFLWHSLVNVLLDKTIEDIKYQFSLSPHNFLNILYIGLSCTYQ
jgi:hypothetical protein